MCYNFCMAVNNFKIEWDAREYEHKERSKDWFWAVGIITVAVAVAAVIFGNVIFAILIIICAFSLSLFINRPPEDVHVLINEKGIKKDHTLYLYDSLESFWIEKEHSHKKIIFHSKKLLMPLIIVPLSEEIDADRLEKTLIRFLPKKIEQLPLAESILEYLGF